MIEYKTSINVRVTRLEIFACQNCRHSSPRQHLVDDDLTLHASSLVRLAVIAVLSGHIELPGDGLTRGVQVVLVGERVGVDSSRDGILVKDNVVRESGVVGPRHGVSLGDGDRGRLEDERLQQWSASQVRRE